MSCKYNIYHQKKSKQKIIPNLAETGIKNSTHDHCSRNKKVTQKASEEQQKSLFLWWQDAMIQLLLDWEMS